MRIPKIQTCPKCYSPKLEFKAEKGNPHHSRLICGECGGFITWVSQQMSKFLSRFGEETK